MKNQTSKSHNASSQEQKSPKSKSKKKLQHSSTTLPNLQKIITSLQNYLNGQLKDDKKKIIKLLQQLLLNGSKQPSKSIQLLLAMYNKYPDYFYQFKKQQKKSLLIFRLLSFIITNYQYAQTKMQDKILEINSQLLKWASQKQQKLTQFQFKQILSLNKIIWSNLFQVKTNYSIMKVSLFFILKLPFSLTIYKCHQQQAYFCQQLIQNILNQLVMIMDKRYKLNNSISKQILSFWQNCIQFLSKIEKYNNQIKIPLLEFCILANHSNNNDLFNDIIKHILSKFKKLTKDRQLYKEQQVLEKKMMRCSMKNLKKVQSIQEPQRQTISNQNNIQRINITLITSNLLNIKSTLISKSLKRQYIFLILLNHKQTILKIIDELQRLQKSLISQSLVLNIYEIPIFCSQISQKSILTTLVSSIINNKETFNRIFTENNTQVLSLLKQSKNQIDSDQFLQKFIKYCQSLIFTICYSIEKTLCNYNLQIFMDEFIKNPNIFRSQYFIQGIFKNYHYVIIKKFMIKLTYKWLMVDMKSFNYNYYLINFFKKCIKEDKIIIIGEFLKQITIEELIKINKIIFCLSFQDDKKKYMYPEYQSKEFEREMLTCVGFSDKFLLINQILTNFSEQLLWRQLIDVINPSINYIIVKSYYNVVSYQFKIGSQTFKIISNIIDAFGKSIIQQNIEDMCIFINCKEYCQENTVSFINSCIIKVFQLIINKYNEISTMFQLINERRRSAMNRVVLTPQMINQNMKIFDRLKRMNTHFMKNIMKWIQSLDNIIQLIPKNVSYEHLLSIIESLGSKYGQRYEYKTLKYLQKYCSQKSFSNLITIKIRPKMDKDQSISPSYIMALIQIMNSYMTKKQKSIKKSSSFILQSTIIKYFSTIISEKVGIINQRQILKVKILILMNIIQLTYYFSSNQNDPLINLFNECYQKKFRSVIIQIAVQNHQLVSKYQRDFILYLRIITIQHIIRSLHTRYQIMDEQNLFAFVYEICIDKHIQIRFMILNILTSRFKQEEYSTFLKYKYHIISLLSIIAIHQSCLHLKITANRLIQKYKSNQQNLFLGFTILLYSIKHLITNLSLNLLRQDYNFSVNHTINALCKLWLSKKDQQYLSYTFALSSLQKQNITFMINPLYYRSYIQYCNIYKEKSDFILQNQLKEYMKKQWEFSFQIQEGDCKNSKIKLINNIIMAMPNRIFQMVKEFIDQNAKKRVINYKKDIKINWQMFQKDKILNFHKEKVQIPDIFRKND